MLKVKEKSKEIDILFNKKIGTTSVRLDASHCREEECNAGNMFADAYAHHFIDQTLSREESWASVAAAVVNGGSVRSGISVGNITTKDIVSASPFGNQIGILTLKGSKLWQILQHSASQYKLGGFLQVSGIRYQFDSQQPMGQRLISVRIKCSECQTPSYEDLVFNNDYKIVITDYLVKGGDNYTMINRTDFISYQILDYDVVSNYVSKYSPIITPVEDRISNKPSVCSGSHNNSMSTLSITNLFIIIAFLYFYQLSNYLKI